MKTDLEQFKKLRGRSLDEIQLRGRQFLAVYADQFGLTGKTPSDEDFWKFVDRQEFGDDEATAENWLKIFQRRNVENFFLAFADREQTLKAFQQFFGEDQKAEIIAQAEKLVAGKFDLLGFGEFDYGMTIDWLREPRTGNHFPREKHWAEMNGAMSGKLGENRLVFELNRQQHFFTLGMAYWLTRDERFAAAFVMQICGWMGQNPPEKGINWASSLEVSLRAISWIWALQFFRDSRNLTPHIFLSIMKFLHLHGRHLEIYLSTYFSPDNHLTGEALGLYYLGTLMPELRRAKHWHKLGKEILLTQIERQVLPDGTFFGRSTYYHRYTADFYTHFLLLSRVNQEKLPSIVEEKLQGMFDFMMHTTRPDGTTPLIGDDDGGKMLPFSNRRSDDFRATLATGAVIFGRPDYKFVAEKISSETLWLLGAEGLRKYVRLVPAPSKDMAKDFPQGGFYAVRDSWEKNANFLLINAGNSEGKSLPHIHADSLSFDLAVEGKTLLTDAGTYSYYENPSARDYFRATSAHNTLTIDDDSSSIPSEMFNWFTVAKAKTKTWLNHERFTLFEGSHNGYENLPEEATHTRSLLFLKNDYTIIRDFVETSGVYRYDLNFHFTPDAEPSIAEADNGIPAVTEQTENSAGLEIFTFGDGGKWRETGDFVSTNYGERLSSTTCSFRATGKGTQEFFTFLLPNNRAVLPFTFEIKAIHGRAFSICYEETEDLFIFNDGESELTRTEHFQSDFRFLWARFVGAENPVLEEIVAIGGKTLIYNAKELINYPKQIAYATAQRLKNNLQVTTDETMFSVSLPKSNPHRSKVYLMRSQKDSIPQGW